MATGVPNFIIRKFRVPPFLLPIYQAAGIEYGIRWEILAAINEIETDYGRNLNVSSAGALGWMQFMPPTWAAYGTDANKDGRKDPYNPVDAIFAAARYLKAAGYQDNVRDAIWAYNHADWYVDSVLLRARLIAGVPADLIGSLTGLTEGRFPVYARARYADDLAEAELLKRVKRGENAAHVIESTDDRRSIDIFAERGAPVVAVNDGVVKEIGRSKKLGRYLTLQDVYGNRYTYSHLGQVSKYYPVPKADADAGSDRAARALKANGGDSADPKPSLPASAGRQTDDSDTAPRARPRGRDRVPRHGPGLRPGQAAPVRAPDDARRARERRPGAAARRARAQGRQVRDLQELLLAALRARPEQGQAACPAQGLAGDRRNDHRARRPDGARQGRASRLLDSAGGQGCSADRPEADSGRLEAPGGHGRSTGPRGATCSTGADEAGGMSIGQILLLPKPLLEKRVLSDERIEIYECGRDDIRSGQIDRRVLATLAYLAESGLKPSVSSLKCGHGYYTSSGNVSHHSSGNAVDISQINGIPILGHQDPGGITEVIGTQADGPTGHHGARPDHLPVRHRRRHHVMADHADHIHVGFQPMFGENKKLGKQALAVLEPGQWSDLISRLGEIENPVVPTKPSKYALPVEKKDRRASDAHVGE